MGLSFRVVRPCVRARARLCQHKHVVFLTKCSCFYQLIYKYTFSSNDTEDQNMFLFKKNISGAYISGDFCVTSHFFSEVMKFVHDHTVFLQFFSILTCNTLYKKSLELILCYNRSSFALFSEIHSMSKIIIDPTVIPQSTKTHYLEKIKTQSNRSSSSSSSTSSYCLIWGKSVNSSGYPQMRFSFPGKCSKKFIVHRMLYALQRNSILDKPHFDVSHLCHSKLCVEVEHLVYEPSVVNAQRRSCKTFAKCCGHSPYPDCMLHSL